MPTTPWSWDRMEESSPSAMAPRQLANSEIWAISQRQWPTTWHSFPGTPAKSRSTSIRAWPRECSRIWWPPARTRESRARRFINRFVLHSVGGTADRNSSISWPDLDAQLFSSVWLRLADSWLRTGTSDRVALRLTEPGEAGVRPSRRRPRNNVFLRPHCLQLHTSGQRPSLRSLHGSQALL